jgi:hypothetical protein
MYRDGGNQMKFYIPEFCKTEKFVGCPLTINTRMKFIFSSVEGAIYRVARLTGKVWLSSQRLEDSLRAG